MKRFPQERSNRSEVWRRLRKNKVAVASMIVLLIVILVAILAPILAPHSYEEMYSSRSLEGPSKEFPLGTDRIGRCVLSRLIYGARQSLQMGIFAVTGATIIGLILGALAGYYGGVMDTLLMRFLDIFQGIPIVPLDGHTCRGTGPKPEKRDHRDRHLFDT
jgi:peptide/nickel transport system permease protein